MTEPHVDTSLKTWDEIKTTTCYMCACRCGIKVYLKDGTVKYIDGNRDHPVNKGVICGKGAAGIMQHYSPARLSKPLLRVGERGAGEFREIEWEEALRTATMWLSEVRNTDPKKLAFFTGRDQSQALTGWWAAQFGTPNYAAHGGFCSVNMAAAGPLYLRRLVLGIRRARLEAHQIFPAVRRGRGSRLQSAQDRVSASSRRAASRSSRSIRCAPAIRRSPMNGSASVRAPTACSPARLIHELLAAQKIDARISRCATPTRPGW